MSRKNEELYASGITRPSVRTAHIARRLTQLERIRQNIYWDQRWPSEKSIRRYKHSLLIPEIEITPPVYDYWMYGREWPPVKPKPDELEKMLAPSPRPKVGFPTPVIVDQGNIGRVRDGGFENFSLLPAEIRVQIWEIELHRPRFIEAQVTSGYGKPLFSGHCTKASSLLSTCKESREIALAMKYQNIRCVLGYGEDWFNPRIQDTDYPHNSRRRIDFVPERDTIFIRCLENPGGSLETIDKKIIGAQRIQHLALCLDSNSLSLRNEWKEALVAQFVDLKTLTFMLGGRDQSWVDETEIELRNLQEWYADGRSRGVRVEEHLLDIGDVGKYLSGDDFESRIRGRGKDEVYSWGGTKKGWKRATEWQGLNVRVVAWSK